MKVDYQSFARRILLGFRLQTPRIPPPNSPYVTFALFLRREVGLLTGKEPILMCSVQ